MTATADEVMRLHTEVSTQFDSLKRNRLDHLFTQLTDAEGTKLVRLCLEDPTPITKDLLGRCHQYGKGVTKNRESALRLYRESADAGNPRAMFHLGSASGVYDPVAIEWIQKASVAGCPEAMSKLGDIYCGWYDCGIARDLIVAVEWFEKGVALGDSGAMCTLGHCVSDQDRRLALFRRSAELEDPSGLYYLGRSSPDEKEKVKLWERSASLGNLSAMWDLAEYYREQKEDLLALEWYERTISFGKTHPWATQGKFHWNCLTVILKSYPDPEALIRWYANRTPDDPEWVESYRSRLEILLKRDDLQFKILHEWRRLTTHNEALVSENERLRTELEYRPGGSGYMAAEADFTRRAQVPES